MNTVIENVNLVIPGNRIIHTAIRFENGKVAGLGADAHRVAGDTVVNGAGRLLTPGLIDLHAHGVMQYAFGNGPDEMMAASSGLTRFGVTTVLPTVVPKRGPDMLDRLSALTSVLDQVDGADMPGLHLEGPFVALPGAGCDVVQGDLKLLDELVSACSNRICAMSVSPDTRDILPVIERLCASGIMPFVTHTRCNLEQAQAAIAAGARHATHFYDVFPLPEEADPGVRPVGAVEAYLVDRDATVDFIADGCHVDPVAIQLAVQAKSCAGVAVITDANIGAGLAPGRHTTPWGYEIEVQPGQGARIADAAHPFCGALAGSALTMDQAMRNVHAWIDATPADRWGMGTRTPAVIAGLHDRGVLDVGCRADAVLWNEALEPDYVWVAGREFNDECA